VDAGRRNAVAVGQVWVEVHPVVRLWKVLADDGDGGGLSVPLGEDLVVTFAPGHEVITRAPQRCMKRPAAAPDTRDATVRTTATMPNAMRKSGNLVGTCKAGYDARR
jgi:hypothetical protein